MLYSQFRFIPIWIILTPRDQVIILEFFSLQLELSLLQVLDSELTLSFEAIFGSHLA